MVSQMCAPSEDRELTDEQRSSAARAAVERVAATLRAMERDN